MIWLCFLQIVDSKLAMRIYWVASFEIHALSPPPQSHRAPHIRYTSSLSWVSVIFKLIDMLSNSIWNLHPSVNILVQSNIFHMEVSNRLFHLESILPHERQMVNLSQGECGLLMHQPNFVQIGDVANSKHPLLILQKCNCACAHLCITVLFYPQKLLKFFCG